MNQHSGVGPRVVAGKPQHGLEPGCVSKHLFKVIASRELLGLHLTADTPVRALDCIGFLTGDDDPVGLVVFDDGRDVRRQCPARCFQNPVFLAFTTAKNRRYIQARDDLGERACACPLAGNTEKCGHAWVQGLNEPFSVHRDYAIGQVAQY
ncbi:hypothetical protein D3C75_827980 [compost metagenome]